MKQAIAIILTALAVAGMAGCNQPDKKQATQEAYARWYGARAKVLLGVGEEHFKTGDMANARNNAREALSLVPDLAPAHLLLARVEIEQGNFAQAAQSLQDASAVVGETAQIVYLQAVVAERRQQYDEALSLYEKARALEPNNPAHVLAAAEVLAATGRPEQGLELIESKLDKLDQATGLHKAAGELAMLVDQPERAIGHFQVARSQQGDDPGIQESLAKAYFFAGKYERVIVSLNDLLRQEGYAKRTWVHSMLGESYLAVDRPREARACFEKATELEAREPHHWVNLAKAALAARDTRRTILAAKEALALQSAQPEAAMLLGYALLSEGDAAAARKVLAPAAQAHPDQAMLTCLLGRTYTALGQDNQARACYQRTLELDPQNQIARAMLGTR